MVWIDKLNKYKKIEILSLKNNINRKKMNYVRFAKYASAYIVLVFASVTGMMYENAKPSHQEFKWNTIFHEWKMIFYDEDKNKQDIKKKM